MTHFGIICPCSTGHLNTMTALGYELKQRSHRVTVIGIEDARQKVEAAGLEFQVIGNSDFPPGATKDLFIKLGNLSGLEALQYTLDWIAKAADMVLRDAPEVIKSAGIEALLVDQVSQEGGTVAEHLSIPFVSVCSALILNRELNIPPFSTLWDYDISDAGLERNRLGYEKINGLGSSLRQAIDRYRASWNLPSFESPNQNYSSLAQITHQPAEFEFPRQELPAHFHFTGSFNNPQSRESVSFPYERLTGQPLVYASLGTLQNQLLWVFEAIAEACQDLDVQLVIALGGGTSPESLPRGANAPDLAERGTGGECLRPGEPIVVGYAPQLELLPKAALTITHAGMNTTLESLSYGVPMVAIPIANDQPGVAARIAWTGTGEVVPLEQVSVEKLHQAIQRVLTDKSYKENALKLQEANERGGRVHKAADIIEQAVATGKPVLEGV